MIGGEGGKGQRRDTAFGILFVHSGVSEGERGRNSVVG